MCYPGVRYVQVLEGDGTITSTTSVAGVNYQLYTSGNVAVGALQAGTGSGLSWTGLAAGNGYYAISTNAATCTATSNAVNVGTYANPTIVTGGTAAAVCYSASAQTTTLAYTSTSSSPTSYSIVWNAAAHTAGLSDQGSTAYVFLGGAGSIPGIIIPAGTTAGGPYTGSMTITNGNGCTATQAITVRVNALPAALVLCGSTICTSPGGNGTITSTTSVAGVNYQLYTSGNVAVGALQAGTGSGLSWTGLAAGNGYYAISTNAATCTATSNAVNVATYANPTIVTGGTAAAVCYSASAQTTTLAYTSTSNSPTSYSIVWNAAAHTAGLSDQGSTAYVFLGGAGVFRGL